MRPSNKAELEQARSSATEVAHRLIDDPAFREQIRENPRATLIAVGLPEAAVTDLLREFHVPRGEISGYELEASLPDTCGWTCFFTCDWTF